MSWCVNPECKKPQNSDTAQVCTTCDTKILLRERYRPIKVIGAGGFGRTFLAIDEDKPSQPRCAVKQLNFSGQNPQLVNKAIELFRQEATLLEALGKHPQIPELLASFKQDERLYIVQEFIEGVNLEQALEQEGVFNEARIVQLLHDILSVLQFVHQQKVFHRDIKPPNIIIRTSLRQPVLIDFGVAKVVNDESFIQKATALGTLHYAAPEQLRGKVSSASDLYSLGVTCIGLITGVRPIENMYDAENLCWLWQNFLPTQIRISEALSQILDKLLQFQCKQRYHSAAEVLQALAPLYVSFQNTQAVNLSPTQINLPRTVQIPPTIPVTYSPTTNKNINQTSQFGIYYIKLDILLKAQKWKEADLETWKLLCMELGKPATKQIESSEISLLTCEHLLKIDQLWTRASQGKFGFSVQHKIFESVARDYVIFCERVEWLTYNSVYLRQSLKFSAEAPAGHLPSRIWAEGDKFWRHLNAMALKLVQCGIATKSLNSKSGVVL